MDDVNEKAKETGLLRDQPGPMSFLHREGMAVKLSAGWPSPNDVEKTFMLIYKVTTPGVDWARGIEVESYDPSDWINEKEEDRRV